MPISLHNGQSTSANFEFSDRSSHWDSHSAMQLSGIVYHDSKTNSCEREKERKRLPASQQTRISGSRTTSHGGRFDLTWPTHPSVPHLDQRTPAASPALPFPALASSGFYPKPARRRAAANLPSPSPWSPSSHSRKVRARSGGDQGGFIQFYYYYAYRHACGSFQLGECDPGSRRSAW